MIKTLLVLTSVMAAATAATGNTQPSVRVEPISLQGPRQLQDQTKEAVIRDYLQSWKSFSAALDLNQPGLLDADFVGTARDKFADTIQQQASLGIRTQYRDLSHDLKIVFYSPEGLSIEMTDKVDYNVQVIDHDKITATQHLSARYIVVLTPTEVRWRVRVFQALPEE
jgi:hypothetical protein